MRFQDAQSNLEDMLSRFWPVGSVYTSRVSTNPAEIFGFGTWVPTAIGRTIVGVDPSDPDFDSAGKLSGSKTVTLTEAQLPSHAHTVTDPGHTHVQGVNSATTGGLSGYTPDTSTNTRVNSGYSTSSATTGITLGNAGSGQAHPNVQPSIAYYAWERTA